MSKQIKAKVVGKVKAVAQKVVHGPIMKTYIPAGMASSAPPLGTMLGQRNLNIANFVKDFNEQTKNIREGTPLPTWIHMQGDRSYSLEIFKPPVGFLLKQAAGISRASMEPGHKVAGVISLKHIYEIAKFKITDKNCAHMDLKQMCIKVINTANRAGIKIIKHDLDPAELKEFLDARKQIEDNELKLLTEKKAAKMMRAPATPVAATTAKK